MGVARPVLPVTSEIRNSADVSSLVRLEESSLYLPFDIDEVIENLRREAYEEQLAPGLERVSSYEWTRRAYYAIRELLPVSVRRHLQRAYFRGWKAREFPSWPVDFTVDNIHEEILRLSMEAAGTADAAFYLVLA